MDLPADGLTNRPALRWRDGLAPVAAGWAVARLCLLFGQGLARLLVDVLPPPMGNRPFEDGLFVWDGMYYRVLSQDWYTALPPDGARFFPLYPALARVLSPLTGGREDLALLVISNVAAFAGALLLWRLVVEVTDDTAVARRAAWMVAVFPSAFVLAFAYTEALALVLVTATLLCLHRRAFVWAGILGFAAALLRPVGGLIVVPIAVELLRTTPRPKPATAAVALGGPVLGLPLAMWWIARSSKDFWLPVEVQGDIRGGFQDPLSRAIEPLFDVVRGHWHATYDLVFVALLVALVVVAVRRAQPWSWLAYAVASLLVLLSSQVIDSLGRYGLVVVPFVVALAQWSERRWRQVAVAVASCSGLIWLSSQAWLGRVVP